MDRLFEERCDRLRVEDRADTLAVDADSVALTYDELDARANRLARHLLERGVGGGHRVALVFDDPMQAYVAMLAVMKVNAAYVPLDPAFPPDRLAYIVEDAGVSVVLTLSHLRSQLRDVQALLVVVDDMANRIAVQDSSRLTDAERGEPVEDLAYLIYTSGTTGRPKGVAIEHASICNFVRVAAETYDIRPDDRMYQGLTIAFDFSVEEIWVTWMVGATLVPKPAGTSLLGSDLHAFLTERRVTALCCVPTLLATIEEDLPDLRFLLVSGEACPQDLINRWYRPGRRFLNTYGPTEATVTATLAALHPDRPVTIGRPLPTYTTVMLDPDNPVRALPHGEVGEIGIAGIGLAAGYLHRDDLTDKAFIPDFLGIPANPSRKIYRTGDLGRVDETGEITYLGRIDLQVKVRGYRIELTEIESVLLEAPGVAVAVVDTFEPTPGTKELVGYYNARAGSGELDPDAITAHLRKRLPAYMVPAFLEQLPEIPMTAQGKVDRRALPSPSSRHVPPSAGEYAAPATDTERFLAERLEATLGIERVSVQSDFFTDLGANSLLMAQFSARIRKQAAGVSVSMRDIYQNPTVRALAMTIGDVVPAAQMPAGADPTLIRRASRVGYVLIGVAQLLTFLAVAVGIERLATFGYEWVYSAPAWLTLVERAAVAGVALFVGLCLLPIVAKWVLVGRWKAGEIRLWGMSYFRFWLVRSLTRLSPLVLFTGSPLYPLYLRALGAKIGRGALILSRTVPVATDLITIGAGSVIRKNTFFTGYRAVGPALELGPVHLGKNVIVGEQSVLDISTTMGDGAQLGHSSSLREGQTIPDGERWHGSPAEPGAVDYRVVPPAWVGVLRKILFSTAQLITALVLVTAALVVLTGAPKLLPMVADMVNPTTGYLLDRDFYLVVAVLSFVLHSGVVLLGLLAMVTLPRLPRLFVRPDRVYRLYGFHYIAMSLVSALTNSRYFMLLLGDSSFIVHFLRALGYDLSRVEQTGSNFGTEMRHDSPFLTTVGTGTMVSDGLSIMNADWSNTSFRVSRAEIGERNFIGNNVVFPVGARTGANTLLATKVMVPLDGPVRRNIGLLGSPPLEIPRNTSPDNPFRTMSARDRRRRLTAKNWHNAGTIVTVLFLQWIRILMTILTVAAGLTLFGSSSGYQSDLALIATILIIPLLSVLYSVLLERAAMGFRTLRPRNCSIYDRYFWRHERLWKVYSRPIFVGTPFRGLLLRLAGVRVGRRVFDDGCVIPEKSLVRIGDNTTLNANSVIQCHSLEDGLFKSDHTVIGAGVTLGIGAFVHYSVTMGDASVLAADSYLMKGEEVPAGASWVGNPAHIVRRPAAVRAAAPTTAATLSSAA